MTANDPADMPDPPIPADIDVRTFDDMPLNVVKLLNSDTLFTTTGEEFKGAVILWARAWHQVPAGSLPNNERHLAQMAGFGTDVRGWRRVRCNVLRGFVLCSDGRLYHPVICDAATKAFAKKTSGQEGAAVRWKEAKALKTNKTVDASASVSPDGKPDGKKGGKPPASPNSKLNGKPAKAHMANGMPRTELSRTDNNNQHTPESDTATQPCVRVEEKIDPVELFETQFWKAYPQRDGENPKKPAREKFLAAVKRGVDPFDIIAGAKAYADHPATKHGTNFVATAVTWLNQERWKDHKPSNAQPDSPKAKPGDPPQPVIPTQEMGGYVFNPRLQHRMATRYLTEWREDGEETHVIRVLAPTERKWRYKTSTGDRFPAPGEPGCPVTPEAMKRAAADLGVTWQE